MTLPVVCWPGASGHHSVYDALIEALPDLELRVADYPGLGAMPARANVDSHAELYAYLVSELPEAFNLVALSMGCAFALQAALDLPERVARLTLLAPTGGVDVVALGGEDWRPGWAERRPNAPRWFVDDRTDLSASLVQVGCPTLIVHGSADPLSPVSVGRYVAARLPGARVETISGATHDLVEEHSQLLAALLRVHLA
jgi:pimeloyl-ACP methyl ester carboxylesterase